MHDADELGSFLCYRTRKFWTQLTLLGNPRSSRSREAAQGWKSFRP